MRVRRTVLRSAAAIAVAVSLAACTNAPPPPLVTTEVARTQATKAPTLNEAVVGVDSVQGGYNPHKLADQSTITTALADVLLPSVFRPAADGTPTLDGTLMVSAEVTSAEPYTVTYRLRPEAAWSDSAPIAAEDFVYLWEQLRTEPGVLDSAGYRLIGNISAREAGRVVEVTFTKPYPGWRTLFSDLLPAHLLKDMPGGWASVLRDNFPVTGGPFSLKGIDRDRGEAVLERNDRYWAAPVPLDRIILRRGDTTGVANALRSGHNQLALLSPDAAGQSALKALEPLATTTTVPRSTVATLLLRPVGTAMADPRIRSVLAALIDRQALTAAGTGGGPGSALPANAQVLAPSARGYTATVPANTPDKPDVALAENLLTQAGYTKVDGSWSLGGTPLNLVIAAPEGRKSYVDMARELQRQLSVGGVQSRLVTPDGADLFTRLLAPRPATAAVAEADRIDLVLAPQPAAGDPATLLAGRFGCAPTTPGEPGQPSTAPQADNPAGFCDPGLQPTIDQALTGELAFTAAAEQVEPALWSRTVALPLYQEADTLLTGRVMSGVSTGPPWAGPFATATQWRRAEG
ncbi:ABC transporter family substrate-binding protein [Actinokineospora auranticolor]|uniref:ABC-type transport system substrate-binding protein n=1 Tax=Actinokineospora auranticolor TaxID=155976 RepID=A0A2S6GYB9_9PSEU|nr:ABC transporter family substrate-binding protein [Actinokineospora auranticolor]PPK70176.1 ABC-type transport system substrate-binding protein [Actinokineospora auranticolor]